MITSLGVHRSIDPPGVMPQAARRHDPSLPIRANEILIDAERLHVDTVVRHEGGSGLHRRTFMIVVGTGIRLAALGKRLQGVS